MSDTILQFVLSDLRPQSAHDLPIYVCCSTKNHNSLLSKLKVEADIVVDKKPTVDTHRGGSFHYLERMCLFSRIILLQKHINSVISFAKLILILLL